MKHVLEEIDTERALQRAQHFDEVHDAKHSLSDWIALICNHSSRAIKDGGVVDPPDFRRQMVKVAALAVAAVESYDRAFGKELDQETKGSGV